ncbi:hypothetical protein, partial [Saccharothrix sp. ST-888]|uniref:hypothetical protein n=1 Tax=Saccharothrix sp. ST-888 TaxID=1427391 RepID=UPI0005EC602F
VTRALRDASAKNLKDVPVSVQAASQRSSDTDADDARSTALTSDLADRPRAVPGVTSVLPTVNVSATLAANDRRPLNAPYYGPNLAPNCSPDTPHSDRSSLFP